MIRSMYFSLLVSTLVLCDGKNVSDVNNVGLNLVYLDRFEIRNQAVGLKEPSGLALSVGRNALWTVSDDTSRVYKLNLEDELQIEESLEIPGKGLEGIALDPTGKFLFMVDEVENEIIKLNVNTREVENRVRLSQIAGYEAVARYFVDSPPNKGLEGITLNTDTGSIFVMKEGFPGLLIEISPNLATIQSHILLTCDEGFIDDEAVGHKLDFSGICYDKSRRLFWIVSDKAQRLFLYNRERNKVIQSFALGYSTKGRYQEIKKGEGVAIDPDSNRLFVVSDKEARLYVFAVRE